MEDGKVLSDKYSSPPQRDIALYILERYRASAYLGLSVVIRRGERAITVAAGVGGHGAAESSTDEGCR